MNKKIGLYIRKNIFTHCIHLQLYISSVILELFCASVFFIGQAFFVRNGNGVSLNAFFSTIPYVCALVFPLIQIKNHPEDFDSLLPFSSAELVWAKWISSVCIFILHLIPVFLMVLTAAFFITIDVGQAVCGFLGLLFYSFSAIAFTIFVFELVPAAAFFISVISLALFSAVHSFLFYINVPSFVSSVLHFFSFEWHFDSFAKGLLDTRDVLFFLVSTFFFVLATVFLIERRKGRCFTKSIPALFLLLLGLIFINGFRYYLRFDVTKNHRNTISRYSRNLVNQTDGTIRITYFRSNELLSLYPEIKNVSDFLSDYSGISKNISFKIVNPKDADVKKKLESYHIQKQQFKKAVENSESFIEVYSAIVIEYFDKYEVIPFVLSSDFLEYDLAVRFEHLLKDKVHSVYIACGNGFDIAIDYAYVLQWLTSQGFICNVLDAKNDLFHIPNADAPLLLFGSSALTETQASEIETFALHGGRVLSFVSPYSVQINDGWSVVRHSSDAFLPVLSSFGFEFDKGMVVDVLSGKNLTFIGNDNSKKSVNYPFWIRVEDEKNAPSGSVFFWTTPIESYNKNIQDVFITSGECQLVSELSNATEKSIFNTNPFVDLRADSSSLSSKKSFVVGSLLDGSAKGFYTGAEAKNVRVMVIADQYFGSSTLLRYVSNETEDYRNLQVLSNLLLSIQDENELLAMQNSRYSVLDYTFKGNVPLAKDVILFVFFILLPVLIFSCRIFVAMIRKRSARG